ATLVGDTRDTCASKFRAQMAHVARARTGRHTAGALSGIAVAAREYQRGSRCVVGASCAFRQHLAAARAQTSQRTHAIAAARVQPRTPTQSDAGAGCTPQLRMTAAHVEIFTDGACLG